LFDVNFDVCSHVRCNAEGFELYSVSTLSLVPRYTQECTVGI